MHVERRDTRRRHRRVGNATGLKVIDEPVEHIALARAGVTGKEDVTPLLQGNVGVPLVLALDNRFALGTVYLGGATSTFAGGR